MGIYFLGKNLINILIIFYMNISLIKEYLKSSSRDNSIMFIRVLIGIYVCDLDVELKIFNSTSRSQTFIPIRTLINIMLLSLEELFQYSFIKDIFIKNIINILIKFFPKK